MESADHVHIAFEKQESSGKFWDSRINVCPGSSPTLAFSDDVKEETDLDHLEPEIKPCRRTKHLSPEGSDISVDWGSDSSWPDLYVPGTWGTQSLEENPWGSEKKPYIKFRKYQDLQLNEVESQGVLTDRIIAACSSYLDKSPEIGKYVLCKVNLANKNLTDISIITYHHYLQYVNLSWNQLTTVEALGQLPFLMYLNLSHNLLTKVLNFKAPFNLSYVNYAHNNILEIDDLTDFWSITHLDLSYNHISVIQGIQNLQYLRHLNLSYNVIDSVKNLNSMKLLTLDLQHNKITTFEEGDNVGFKTLIDILRINLSYNRLTTLRLFKGVTGIQAISIAHNYLDDLIEIMHLSDLNFLTEVDFRGNPFVKIKFYFEACVNTIKYLYVLDGEIVDAEKKVLVKSSFNPSLYMQAIRKSSKIFFLQQINDPFLGPPIVPIDQPPPPIIILVGTPGSNKKKILNLFCKQHKKFTILGVSHTTRGRNDNEVDGETYYFIDRTTFRTMMRNGEFLTASQQLGQYFGLAQSEIGKTVNKSSVLMLQTNVTGALTLRTRGLRCHLVLALPSTAKVYRRWLLEKFHNWHDSSRFVGAVEVENCPEKAMHFLNSCEKNLEQEIETMAEGIVAEAAQNAMKLVDGVERGMSVASTISDESCDGSSESGSAESVKASASSSHTSGILKSPASQSKGMDYSNYRVSVTFQNANIIPSADVAESQANLQASRSVTFDNVQNTEHDVPGHLTKYSVSGTVVANDEHGSALALSVLSQSKRDSAVTFPIVWDIQAKALKSVVEDLANTRDLYLDMHFGNPGLFTEVIFTDDVAESLNKLKHLLKQCIKVQPNAKPIYECPKDDVYHKIVTSRLESLHNEINSELSITQKQMNSTCQSTSKPRAKRENGEAKKCKKPHVGFQQSSG